MVATEQEEVVVLRYLEFRLMDLRAMVKLVGPGTL